MFMRTVRRRIAVIALIGALGMLASTSYAGNDTWTAAGPYGLQFTGIYFDPRGDQTMYATTYSSTGIPLYKSTDSGDTWRPSSTGIPSSSPPLSYGQRSGLAFDPENPSILYLARGDGLYRSLDSGAHWQRKDPFAAYRTQLTAGVASVTISPADGALLVGTAMDGINILGGIFRSSDHGESWEWLPGLRGQDIAFLAFAPSAPHIVYAGGNTGFFKSVDGGRTWSSFSALFGGQAFLSSIAIDPNNSQVVFASLSSAGLVRTDDGGVTWRPISYAPESLVFDPKNPQVMYAGATLSGVRGLYRTQSNADTAWELISDAAPAQTFTSLALDTRTPQSIFIGTPTGIWKRTMSSGPQNYSVSINAGTLFTNKTAVELTLTAPEGTDAVMLSNDGGFAGASWEPLQTKRAWTLVASGSAVLPRIVYARFRTNGKVSGLYQDDIVLDQQKPAGSVTIAAPSAQAAALTATGQEPPYRTALPLICNRCRPGYNLVSLQLSATDNLSGVGAMRISNTGDFTGAAWQLYAQTAEWFVPEGQRTTVFVQFRDRALNSSEPATASYSPPAP